MQIKRNGNADQTTEDTQDDGAFVTNDHPLEDGQDQIVDYEPGTGSATLDEFRSIAGNLGNGGSPEPEPEGDDNTTAPTESTQDNGDTGTDEQSAPEVDEPVEPPSDPTPEVIEDVPHDEGAEEESAVAVDQNPTQANAIPQPTEEPATEDSPVGDSLAVSPGPVDPPSEG